MILPRATLLPLAVVACLTLGVSGCRREEPRLTIEPEMVDFGRVVHRDRVDRSFVLHNQAAYPIFVREIKANCSCFKVHRFQRNLLPGDKREVRVTFDSSLVPPEKLRGKKLDLICNDAQAPRLAVPMEGDVVTVFGIKPDRLSLGLIHGENRSAPRRIQVRGAPGMEVELDGARVQPEGLFTVEIEDKDGGMDIVLELEDDATGQGPLRATLALRLIASGPEIPRRSFVQAVRIEGTWP